MTVGLGPVELVAGLCLDEVEGIGSGLLFAVGRSSPLGVKTILLRGGGSLGDLGECGMCLKGDTLGALRSAVSASIAINSSNDVAEPCAASRLVSKVHLPHRFQLRKRHLGQ